MTVEADVETAVKKTLEHFKRLDVLIPNAGVLVRGSIETVSMGDYDKVMEINVRSVVLLMKLCSPYLMTAGQAVLGYEPVAFIIFFCVSPPLRLYLEF